MVRIDGSLFAIQRRDLYLQNTVDGAETDQIVLDVSVWRATVKRRLRFKLNSCKRDLE